MTLPVPAAVGELVERFDSHRDAYRSGRYDLPKHKLRHACTSFPEDVCLG